MLEEALVYFLLFFSYAVLGWCMEVIVKFIEYKRFVNRGFLIGPYCPIYGMGALTLTFLLNDYKSNPVLLFLLGTLIASVIEYVTSWLMEKIFNARWWDYSNDRFNINGRVCLATMIPFGLLGLLILYVLNPIFMNVYSKLSYFSRINICAGVGILFMIDMVVSTVILFTFRNDSKKFFSKDNTEEMSYKVKEVLSKLTWGQKRLIIAFPHLKHVGNKLKENAKGAIDRYNKVIDAIKDRYYNR